MNAYDRMTDAPPISRRTAIMQAGLAAAALAGLSGCTNYGASETPSSAPSSAAGPLSAKTADIPVGGGKIFADAQAVITQPTAGQFKAFTSICSHAQCPVNDVTDTINCNCHGSMFSIEDGSVAQGPAENPLAEVALTIDGDSISLA